MGSKLLIFLLECNDLGNITYEVILNWYEVLLSW